MSCLRKYGSPRLLMPCICERRPLALSLGVSPRFTASERPCLNCDPLPNLQTRAVALITPIPGIVLMIWQWRSLLRYSRSVASMASVRSRNSCNSSSDRCTSSLINDDNSSLFRASSISTTKPLLPLALINPYSANKPLT